MSFTLLTWRIQKTFFSQGMENCWQRNRHPKGLLMSRHMEIAAIKSIILREVMCLLFVKTRLHFCSARVNGICKSCLTPPFEEGSLFAFMFVSVNWLATCLFIPQIRQQRIVIIFHCWPTISALKNVTKGWKHPLLWNWELCFRLLARCLLCTPHQPSNGPED